MTSNFRSSEFVTDTMGLVLRLKRRRMPDQVKEIFRMVEAGQAMLYVPGFVFAEILYLSERNRIQTTLSAVESHIQQHEMYKESPLTMAIIQTASEIRDIPELHDRLIAATARYVGARSLLMTPKYRTLRSLKQSGKVYMGHL